MNKLSKILGAIAVSCLGGCENVKHEGGSDVKELNKVVQTAREKTRKIEGEVQEILNSYELIEARAHFQDIDDEGEKKRREERAKKYANDPLGDPATLEERMKAREEIDKLWDQ